jgi:hypothetical protein
VPFLDVLLTADRGLVVSFIERGADPIADHPLPGPSTSSAPRRPSARTWIAGVSDLTSRKGCSGRPTWPCANSRRRGISSGSAC